ncbi:hypothetical protein BsWGS_15410 [Bradybaena similaris]
MARILTTAVLAVAFLCASVSCQADTCYEKADVLFVLDASGSVLLENFQKQLQFAATFVNRFVVGQAKFSVIRFESTAEIVFGFNRYTDATSLKNAILNIAYTEGGTDTAAALRLARQVGFSTANGARTGVPKVVIVCTDGMSNVPSDTAIEAKNLKDSNVLVLSIGIGSSVNKAELDTIASFPEDVFVVIDYNQLLSIVYDYSELICRVLKLFRCNNQTDVYFLLDSSSNVGPDGYQRELQFLGNVSKNFDLSAVYFGAASFGGFDVQRIFNLGQIKDQFQLEQDLATALYMDGITNTNNALQFVTAQRVFDASSGGRANTSKILVVVTDGHSITASQAERTAYEIRSSGVNIIAVGVSSPNVTELKTLASHPVLGVVTTLNPAVLVEQLKSVTAARECELPQRPARDVSNICRENFWENGIHPHPYNCSQFIQCTFLKTDVLSCPGFEIYDPEIKTCNYPGFVKNPCINVLNPTVPPTLKPVVTLPTPTSAPCRAGLLDILFIIDSSAEVGTTEFGAELRFAANLAENFHLGPDAIEFAATTFGDSVVDLFNLGQYGNYTPLQRAILGAHYLGGAPNTAGALQQGINLISSLKGARPGVPKVAILFTSGRSSNNQTTIQAAAALKQAGAHVIVVGFSSPNLDELKVVASSPNDVYRENEFDKVFEALRAYSNTTCAHNTDTVVCYGIQFADVIFVLDSSNSIADADYERELTFVADVTSSFTLGIQHMLFGALVFGTETVKLFDLKDFNDTAVLRSAILSAQHLQSGTDTAKAINFINQQQMFSASAGGRANATKIVIILTDGRSNSMTETVSAASRLKAAGVQFISIGVGDLVFEEELRQLASSSDKVFLVPNFAALNATRASVTRTVCYVVKEPDNVPDYSRLCASYRWADGIHPNPNDCTSYVECYAFTTTERKCLTGYAFDPISLNCVAKNLAHPCSDPNYFGPVAATASPLETWTTRGPSTIDVTSICSIFHLIDGIYPDPGSCNHFVECTAELTSHLECPSGLNFNTANDVCDDVHVVNCQINYDYFLHYG